MDNLFEEKKIEQKSITKLIILRTAWKNELQNKKFLLEAIPTLFIFIIAMMYYSGFVSEIESRAGVELPDPVLAMFEPIELAVPIFAIIYISILYGLFQLARQPHQLIFALQVYIVFIIVRITAMYLTPFEKVPTSITLADPIVQYLGTGHQLTRDLFFSGHTSTMFILFLTAIKKREKYIFGIGTIVIGAFMVLQHAHYTIDVFAAPFLVYGCYRIVLLTKRKLI